MVGGATVTEEIFPGFRYSVFSYVVSLMRPEIIRELDLPRHGLTILPLESTLTPLPDGDRLYRDGDHFRSWREIARFSVRDAEAYDDYGRSALLHGARGEVPARHRTARPRAPRPSRHLRPDRAGPALPGAGSRTAAPAGEADDHERGGFSSTSGSRPTCSRPPFRRAAIIGTFLGPRSPGTAYVLLHHYMGEIDGHFRAWGFASGGTGAVAEAIASAAREAGAEIPHRRAGRPGARPERTRHRRGAPPAGTRCTGRSSPPSLDPRRTFLDLVEEHELPGELLRAVRAFRFRGSSGKVNLALDAAPDFSCMPGHGPHLRGAVSISPSLDYLERAYDDAKYGDFSKEPYIGHRHPLGDRSRNGPLPASTSCRASSSTRPTSCARGTGTKGARPSATPWVDTLARYIRT